MASGTWITVGVASVLVLSCIVRENTAEIDRLAAIATAAGRSRLQAEQARKVEIDNCRGKVDAMKAEYAKLFDARQFWNAARSIATCHTLLDDAELKSLVAQAETQEYMTVASDTKQTPGGRVLAIEALRRSYPEKAAPFIPLLPGLQARADKAAAEEGKRAERARLAQRKKEGVTLGMTEEEVLQSSWGKPDKINRSHGSWGMHEQWVYRDRSSGYLYFENGKLTSVQN